MYRKCARSCLLLAASCPYTAFRAEINITAGAGNTTKSILFSSHNGAYEGVIRSLEPKPDLAIIGLAGRANLNGKSTLR